MNSIQIAGAKLEYVDQGIGQALLLVHGFPLDHSQWNCQIDELANHVRVLAPDLPGFGRSELGSNPLTLRRIADDLARLLDELQIETVTYCGLSMGGYIGWQFWKYHRDRLERLIACDTRAAADLESVARARRINAEMVRKNGTAFVADQMIPKLFHAENLKQRSAEVEAVRQVIYASNPETLAQAQLAMAERPDAMSCLPEIGMPTLFVVGAQDQITTPSEMSENAGQVRGAQLVEISNSGHLPPLENPHEFNRAVMSFLGA
jgi:pimeloyl-ACP methyl ester carboxylesterase